MLRHIVRATAGRNSRFPHPLSTNIHLYCSLVDDKTFRMYTKELVRKHKILFDRSMKNNLTAQERNDLLLISKSAELAKELDSVDHDLAEVTEAFKKEGDQNMRELLENETKALSTRKDELFDEIVLEITPVETDEITDIILEVHAGVGGLEAGLFAHDMYTMYERFAVNQGWKFVPREIKEMEGTHSSRAINSIQVNMSGDNVYKLLKFESGIHRVQRVPSTEKSGRIHTSTAVVVILPKPAEIKINIEQKDIKLDTFRSQGGGGQSVNTTDSAVRLTHLPTGTVIECQQTRSQIKNREFALEHLKSHLYEQQLCDQQTKTASMRRLQIGGANRNEKIRTYNYVQDRVTDHRMKLTVSGISELLEGGEKLSNLIRSIMDLDKQERFKIWLAEQDNGKDKSSNSTS
ncbi:peptide chain release factor 1-like [Watersipora subatra]|uniref:peptide chain release factor 1-like n=1 Tax=Watersipora subatra TaxID=2589382 RepID=UPI00355B81B2